MLAARLLGVLADGAGVDDEQVGVFRGVDGFVAEARQAGGELRGVGLVHLTAEGPDVVAQAGPLEKDSP